MLPFFDQYDVPLLRVLTDRGTEFCGRADAHDYELFLALNDIEHSRTKTKSPQTNAICERFQKTALDGFYRIALRRKIYTTLEELQKDLNEWLGYCYTQRPHQGKRCQGKTPVARFLENLPLAKEILFDMKNGELPMAA